MHEGGEEEGGEKFLSLMRVCTRMREGVEEREKEFSPPRACMHAHERRRERIDRTRKREILGKKEREREREKISLLSFYILFSFLFL